MLHTQIAELIDYTSNAQSLNYLYSIDLLIKELQELRDKELMFLAKEHKQDFEGLY